MLKTVRNIFIALTGAALLCLAAALPAWADNAQRISQINEMYQEYKKDFPQAPEMTPQEALKLWKSGQVQFVDVREEAEMEVSILPGAISWEQYRKAPAKYADKKVVLYCTIGYRSGERVLEAIKDGAGNVYNLAGSILSWAHAGGQVFKDGKEVKRIHVYGRKWDLAPEGYEGVYKKGWFW